MALRRLAIVVVGTLVCIPMSARLTPVSAYDRDLWFTYTSMNVITSIAEGHDEVYIGTTGGVRRFDRYRKLWLAPITTLDNLPDNTVLDLHYDDTTGDLWIATRTGNARWMSGIETVSVGGLPPEWNHPAPAAIPPLITPFGYSLQRGVVRGPRAVYPITATVIDSWQNLWLGTAGLGVGMADLRFSELEFDRSGPLMRRVMAIARDGDALWFAGTRSPDDRDSGISRFEPERSAWSYFIDDELFGLDDAEITSILPDSSRVWFAGLRNLVRYDRKSDRWDTFDFSRWLRRSVGPATSLVRDGSRIWIGTYDGLAVFDLAADSLRSVPGSRGVRIHHLASGDDAVWAATDDGLFRTRQGQVKWEPIGGAGTQTRGTALAVAVSGDTVAAVMQSPGGVLVRTHPDSAWLWQPISEVGGNPVAGLALGYGRIWVGTEDGLIRVRLSDWDVRRLSRSNGLVNDRVRCMYLDRGFLWIGTDEGVSRYEWARDFLEEEP